MSDDEFPPDDAYATPTIDPAALVERQVVGTAIRFPHAVAELGREVSGGDFHDLRLGRIFTGVADMVAAGEPVDALAVLDHLAGWEVRGIDITDLYAWADAALTPEHGARHARTVRAASMRRLLAAVGDELRDPDADPAEVIAHVQSKLAAIRDLAPGGRRPVTWLGDVMNVPEEDDAYDWLIPDLLERGDRLMLTAFEGKGKSMLLRQMGICAAAGVHPFQFHQINPCRVLFIDAENTQRQWRRSSRKVVELARLYGHRDPSGFMAVENVGAMDLTKPDDMGLIHAWMDEAKPDLVVIGPLYRMTRGGLNKDEDVEPVLRALDTIRDRGVAMLIELHSGHGRDQSGSRDLRPRGSSALLGWPEFGLGLRENKTQGWNAPTYSLVRWRGDRDRRQWPTLRRDGTTWPWETTAF